MASGRLRPETDPEITAPFEVRDAGGVLRELRRMVDRHAPVALYDADEHVVRAEPVSLSPAGLVLALDPEDVHSPALSARELTLVALVDDVKIQGELAGPVVPDGDGVVRLRFPQVLIRLQRRAGYRVRIPPAAPSFLHGPGDAKHPVLDLSVRGVGLAPSASPPPVGEVWRGCRLRLGMQVLPVSVAVRYVDRDRIGCAFVELDARVDQELGRRVMELDRLWMRGR